MSDKQLVIEGWTENRRGETREGWAGLRKGSETDMRGCRRGHQLIGGG